MPVLEITSFPVTCHHVLVKCVKGGWAAGLMG